MAAPNGGPLGQIGRSEERRWQRGMHDKARETTEEVSAIFFAGVFAFEWRRSRDECCVA